MVVELEGVSPNISKENIDADGESLLQDIHRTIEGVTDDLEKFHFNRAVARIRQLTNSLTENEIKPAINRQGVEIILRLLAPMTPHICAELWGKLGNKTSLFDIEWPSANPKYLQNDSIILPVQVNGKKRATIELPREHDKAAAEIAALSNEAVQRSIAGNPVRKVIVVPGKIVNVVL